MVARKTKSAQKSESTKNRAGINWARFFSTRHAETSNGPAPVAAHAFSGNLLIVLGVLAVILFLSWGSLSSYVQQQSEISQVKSDISQLQSENTSLQDQLNLWKDDNYAKQQAKSRLFYLNQGETSYMVTGVDQSSSLADGTSASALTAPEESWVDKLWGSFQEAAVENQPRPSSSASSSAQPSSSASASSKVGENPAGGR